MKQPNDNNAYRFPVSIKGILIINQKVPLLMNERNEYELPGGKLELNEDPNQCLIRELYEELAIVAHVKYCIDTWVYTIRKDVTVFITTYFCQTDAIEEELTFSHEHKSLLLCPLQKINDINMPEGYKNSIQLSLSYQQKKHDDH